MATKKQAKGPMGRSVGKVVRPVAPAIRGKARVDAIVHKDKRVNIPTRELRDFVEEDERAPKTMLYPRDPSLDPQLVWKGKDTQDRQDLVVPTVPIYIQEKIHPQALIQDLRPGEDKAAADQLDFFAADFNGAEDDFSKKVDFYHHDQHWTNRLILGDSLMVMTSLAQKEGLQGKVQAVYFDPPYGIKFGSNWQVSTRKRDVKDGKIEDATRQPEQVRAFRDTWRLGIHSYLSYLRDRLLAARDLLAETGSIFLQIGDENVHLVRSVLDEVFGSENFVSLISCAKTTNTTGRFLPGTNDYILWYGKDAERTKYRQIFFEKEPGGQGASAYTRVELPDGTRRGLSPAERSGAQPLPKGSRLFRLDNLTSPRVREARTGYYGISFEGKTYHPQAGEWKTHKDGIARLQLAGRLASTGPGLYYVRYIDDFPAFPVNNAWADTVVAGFAADKFYVVQTSPKIVERCLLMTTDPGDLVLDPTCGSGTTAFVAEQWGRRWITVDTSRVALALARTRFMGAKFSYYLLADSAEGARKEAELTATATASGQFEDDIRRGFVYKRVPHVTLKSIANNDDIVEGMKPTDIRAAISRHTETEILYDKPYEDPKRVRVTGPFTVESLSPHRILSTDDDMSASEVEGHRDAEGGSGSFVAMILENLRKAGVQNSRKGERLKFDRLDSFAGTWIQAVGHYTDADGKSRRVAVSVGPEHGTVGPDHVKEAAKEAVKGVGFDLLLVCGFAFDPHVTEEAKRYGKLTVLVTRMNPDLSMGDELLKKTGAGNLFMVFGEPEVDIKKTKDGTITVEIKGLDVYDPTTGQVRSSTTDDIACWFIDTNYNGESFFVRHAYFTGADEPYEKLKRALRAEIDEAAWSTLYSTTSRPFPKPPTGKIAVKVINHYGDEVLKVFPL